MKTFKNDTLCVFVVLFIQMNFVFFFSLIFCFRKKLTDYADNSKDARACCREYGRTIWIHNNGCHFINIL